MRSDVADAARATVGVQCVKQFEQRLACCCPASVQSLERLAVAHEDAQQRSELITAPALAHIGRAHADGSAECSIRIESGIFDFNDCREIERGTAFAEAPFLRTFTQDELAFTQALQL